MAMEGGECYLWVAGMTWCTYMCLLAVLTLFFFHGRMGVGVKIRLGV